MGYLVSEHGVEPVQAIQQWLAPHSLKALRCFLGLMGFYWLFIKGYATVVTPLTQLLTKDQFGWSYDMQRAFDALKDAVSKASVLLLPNFFVVCLRNTCMGVGIGAILSQQGHPIAFFSKPFCPKLLHASTYVREFLPLLLLLKNGASIF